MIRYSSKLLTYILSVILTACSSFSKYPNTDAFDDIISLSVQTKSLFVVIAGDLSTYELLKSKQKILGSHNDSVNFVFCDLSMPENLNIRRILLSDEEHFPLIILVQLGKIIGVSEQYRNFQSANELIQEIRGRAYLSSFHERDGVLINQLNVLYCVDNFTQSEDIDTLNLGIKMLNSLVNNSSIYTDCLLAKLYKRIGNENGYKNLINQIITDDRFINNPLFFSLMNDYFEDNEAIKPIIKIDNPLVNLGRLKQGDIKEYYVHLQNLGESNLVVYQVAASCSCVEPTCSRVVPPQKTTLVKIKFHATDSPGAFYKEVFLTTNANISSIRIPIVGTIHN